MELTLPKGLVRYWREPAREQASGASHLSDGIGDMNYGHRGGIAPHSCLSHGNRADDPSNRQQTAGLSAASDVLTEASCTTSSRPALDAAVALHFIHKKCSLPSCLYLNEA